MPVDSSQLVAQIAFIFIVAIPTIVITGVMIFAVVKFAPTLVKQMQQLTDNNAQLTKIAAQNATQFANTQSTLASITPELVKQTQAIEAGNTLILTQGIDFRAYQTLVSDNLSHHATQIETNTNKVDAALASMGALQTTLAQLPAQIVLAIKDEFECESVLMEFQSLRAEVTRAMFNQQRATGTFPTVPTSRIPPSTPPSMIPPP